MESIKLRDKVYWVGAKDPDLRVFDIIMKTEYGTTYNSYLIKGQKNILIETVKVRFGGEYIEKIESLLQGGKLDYLITNHTEPDHSGAVRNIITKYPDIQVIGTRPAYMYLKAMLNEDLNFRVVSDGEELKLGDKTFKFIIAPFLHWPDTMFSYCIEDNMLFSGDFLGCHYSMETGMILNTDAGDFLSAFKYYFEVIMSPFKPHALKALDKIKDLNIEMVGTSHGPILVKDIDKYMALYRQWSQPNFKKSDRKYVLIGYVSAYGYTQTIAEALYERLKQNQGLDVDLIDISEYKLEALKEMIENADGVLIGSPTFNQDALKPVWDALSVVCPINVRGIPAAAFGSYGWSGEAVKLLEDRMKGLKFKVIESGLRFNFTPSDMDLLATAEFADKFAELLT